MKKKFFYFVGALLIFISGLLTERFQLDNRLIGFSKLGIDSVYRFFYSFSNNKKVEIFIDQKEYNKILTTRKKAIEKGLLQEQMQTWAEANLISENSKRDIRVRLKGVFPDHWQDNKRWSFKVRVKNNSKNFNDFSRFNLQPPETSSFIYEWLLMKALDKENLISLKTDYYDLFINGTSRGLYMFQGGISKQILDLNKRKIGPIVGFSKQLFLKEYERSQELVKKGLTGSLNSKRQFL